MPNESRPGSPDNRKIHDGMEHLILCEGLDEWKFLVSYLNNAALSSWPELSRIVQVENFGGNEQLSTKINLWSKAPGFENIKSLVVIRDAETNAAAAVQSINSAFRNAGLPEPKRPGIIEHDASLSTGFLLFPACSTELIDGTLEDLCLSILEESEPQILHEISLFMNGLSNDGLRTFPHEFKSKLHTYFSVTDDYVSFKIGEAADAGAFDWTSEKLQPLRDFLISMV